MANATPHAPTPAEQSYVDTLAALGFYHVSGPAQVIMAGYEICAELHNGYTPDEAAHALWSVTDLSIDGYDARFIVNAAQNHLCPETLGRTLA